MNSCKIYKALTQEICDTYVGGIAKVAFANWDKGHTFTQSSGSCEIDTISLANSEKIYEVEVNEESTFFNVKLNDNTTFKNYTHLIEGTIGHISCDVLEQYKEWSLGKLIAFVLTNDGEVYALGVDNGLSATQFDIASGTAKSDGGGITFHYEGVQKNVALKIKDWSIIEALYPTPNNG